MLSAFTWDEKNFRIGQNWGPSDRIRQAACLVAGTGDSCWICPLSLVVGG